MLDLVLALLAGVVTVAAPCTLPVLPILLGASVGQTGGARPALIALGGSLSFATLMLITRSLRATPDIVMASSQFVGTFLLGVGMSAFHWVPPTPGSLALFALAGCTSVAALFCVNRSLKLAPASVVVPYQYSMIVWAVAFGIIVFGDVPAPATILGAAIIVAAGLYIFLREKRLGREEAVVNPPA